MVDRPASGDAPTGARLTPEDRALLLRLLDTPTAGPLETSGSAVPVRLWEAGRDYAAAAERLGMRVERHAAPSAEEVLRDDVPEAVRDAVRRPGFLDCQPSLVLRLGPPDIPRAATAMINVHLDTVGGRWPAAFDGARFHGRGAIDAKGPAVALLAGIRAALAAAPALGQDSGVLVQAVAGEEGGAMGTFGTRPLVERGLYGRLNIFCEPTGHRYMPRATAAMTACVRVRGEDAVDDHPEAGHNATALLGHLAHHLSRTLPGRIGADGRVCVAGLHTGDRHNRVYGSGRLLLNLSYASCATAVTAEAALHTALHEGLAAFRADCAGHPTLARTADDAEAITSLHWLKRGLPALTGPAEGERAWAERLLERDAGIARRPDDVPAFTCDAIWLAGLPDTYTAVLGPGGLDANRAHADGEYADLAELDRFAGQVARLLTAFARGRTATPGPSRPPAAPSAASRIPDAPGVPDTPHSPDQTAASRAAAERTHRR